MARRTYACNFLFAPFRFQGVCECCHYLYVSRPLDFRLVIQVLKHPCMILNACVHRRHPCLTSLAEDMALLQGWYNHILLALPELGIEPESLQKESRVLTITPREPLKLSFRPFEWKLTYTTFHIQNKITGLVAERREIQIPGKHKSLFIGNQMQFIFKRNIHICM